MQVGPKQCVAYDNSQPGAVAYGAGGSYQTQTLWAKAYIQTNGAAPEFEDDDNVASVVLVGNDLEVTFGRSFADPSPAYVVQITPSARQGNPDGAHREFQIATTKTPAGFRINAIDFAGVVVNHGLVNRAYSVTVFGRGVVGC